MRSAFRQSLAIASVLSAMALVVLDANIANVALPTIAHALEVSAAHSVWVVTAYQAALVMALLPAADLAQSIGMRRTFAGGVALFTLASLGCALAPSLVWLAAARFLQGLGGAAIMALGVALLRFTVGPRRLGDAIGWNSLTVALCSALGPAIGVAILSAASWHFPNSPGFEQAITWTFSEYVTRRTSSRWCARSWPRPWADAAAWSRRRCRRSCSPCSG